MSTFEETLAALTAKEAHQAQTDPDRMASLIEVLASAVGTVIAVAAQGDPKRIDTLFDGFESYAHGRAVEMAPLLRMTKGTTQ